MEQIVTTGRRKTSTARVFFKKGSGEITVNGKDLNEYFHDEISDWRLRYADRQATILGKVQGITHYLGSKIIFAKLLYASRVIVPSCV